MNGLLGQVQKVKVIPTVNAGPGKPAVGFLVKSWDFIKASNTDPATKNAWPYIDSLGGGKPTQAGDTVYPTFRKVGENCTFRELSNIR